MNQYEVENGIVSSKVNDINECQIEKEHKACINIFDDIRFNIFMFEVMHLLCRKKEDNELEVQYVG